MPATPRGDCSQCTALTECSSCLTSNTVPSLKLHLTISVSSDTPFTHSLLSSLLQKEAKFCSLMRCQTALMGASITADSVTEVEVGIRDIVIRGIYDWTGYGYYAFTRWIISSVGRNCWNYQVDWSLLFGGVIGCFAFRKLPSPPLPRGALTRSRPSNSDQITTLCRDGQITWYARSNILCFRLVITIKQISTFKFVRRRKSS